jgi:hypothetical protein
MDEYQHTHLEFKKNKNTNMLKNPKRNRTIKVLERSSEKQTK